ncbi:MAG: hypothetical protein ACREJD_10240 [Phycisphaerales bacterium]
MTTAETISLCVGIVSACTFIVSLAALVTTWRLWRLTNRPTVTVAVETFKSGNMGTALNLVVNNVGTRPAKDVRLSVDEAVLSRLLALGTNDPTTVAVRRCFSAESAIPILIPGHSHEGSFGFLALGSPNSTWREQARLPIEVSYNDLDTRRRFRYVVSVRIADSESFTGSTWNAKSK